MKFSTLQRRAVHFTLKSARYHISMLHILIRNNYCHSMYDQAFLVTSTKCHKTQRFSCKIICISHHCFLVTCMCFRGFIALNWKNINPSAGNLKWCSSLTLSSHKMRVRVSFTFIMFIRFFG